MRPLPLLDSFKACEAKYFVNPRYSKLYPERRQEWKPLHARAALIKKEECVGDFLRYEMIIRVEEGHTPFPLLAQMLYTLAKNIFLKRHYLWIMYSYMNVVSQSIMAKVLCKPHFENPHLVTGRCETGKSKSARISPYYKFQKRIHDGSVSGSWPPL